MDIEFHYYITYLVAARAGFDQREAYALAYSSQYVDDNDLIFKINRGTPQSYSNYISQTINIFKPKLVLLRIYPVFHFIPGDPFIDEARRKDGKLHYLNTTPDSGNARAILRTALDSGDIYRIGLACHSYADTWAHKNFVGYFDEFNAMRGVVRVIGHVAALDKPDRPAVTWEDSRLVSSLAVMNNKAAFLTAAGRLFEELRRHLFPGCPDETVQKNKTALTRDIDRAIGKEDPRNKNSRLRIERYQRLALKKEYGGAALKDYDMDEWMDEAVNENVRGFRVRSKKVVFRFIKGKLSNTITPFKDHYTWKDPANYQLTRWYCFQEAVKAYQETATEILVDSTLWRLELENW